MIAEFTIFVLTLFNEAAICDEHEIQKVARVIMVRTEEQKTSIRKTCLQPKQFSCWNGKRLKHKILTKYHAGVYSLGENRNKWKVCERVAYNALAGQFNRLPRWNHYYNPKTSSPTWKDDLKNKVKDEYHIFGRIEE